MHICVCLMWNKVSFGHVHIVFYVHMNSSRVTGWHDVWVIRIYARCHDVLRPTVWSDGQIEIESWEHASLDSVKLLQLQPTWFRLVKCSMFMASLRLTLWSAWVRVNPARECLCLTLSMLYGIYCMCVHCMTKPLVMQTLLLPFRPCQIVDLAVRNLSHFRFSLYSPCFTVNPTAVYGSSKCVLSRTYC